MIFPSAGCLTEADTDGYNGTYEYEGSSHMKRIISVLTMLMFVSLTVIGCRKTDLIAFTAVVEDLNVNSAAVTTGDNVGFDKATVYFTEDMDIDFLLETGQTVKITVLPEIRESYPVQVSAVKIELISEAGMAEYKKITAEDAKKIIDSDERFIVLDVRTKEEYDEGHIKNAVFMPYDETDSLAGSLIPEKDAKLLVYCRTGRRSELAAEALLKMGYTDVSDFGGINDWPYEIVRE
jgi:rhodanese-related sulfurtransferase